MRPIERARRCHFDNDEDQEAFRAMWIALCVCEPEMQDLRMMFVAARLFAKLERFSAPAPDGVPPIGLRRQRCLPPYPGHPIHLDLALDEMALVEICIQLAPWGTLEQKRRAAATLEWMLKSDLVEIDLLAQQERVLNEAYEQGRLVDSEGQKIQ